MPPGIVSEAYDSKSSQIFAAPQLVDEAAPPPAPEPDWPTIPLEPAAGLPPAPCPPPPVGFPALPPTLGLPPLPPPPTPAPPKLPLPEAAVAAPLPAVRAVVPPAPCDGEASLLHAGSCRKRVPMIAMQLSWWFMGALDNSAAADRLLDWRRRTMPASHRYSEPKESQRATQRRRVNDAAT